MKRNGSLPEKPLLVLHQSNFNCPCVYMRLGKTKWNTRLGVITQYIISYIGSIRSKICTIWMGSFTRHTLCRFQHTPYAVSAHFTWDISKSILNGGLSGQYLVALTRKLMKTIDIWVLIKQICWNYRLWAYFIISFFDLVSQVFYWI